MRLHIMVARGYDEEHFYDIGTRETYGRPRQKGERPRFLEDFIDDYDFVKILEYGVGYFKCDHDDQSPPMELPTLWS